MSGASGTFATGLHRWGTSSSPFPLRALGAIRGEKLTLTRSASEASVNAWPTYTFPLSPPEMC
jgi:hypothetical protein